jgi:competence protein ComEC
MTRWALALCLAACGGGSRASTPPPRPAPAPTMKAHFIDGGQGDATLLEFSCAAVLIDTGGEFNEGFDAVAALRDYLDAFFARRADLDRTLALLVITHPHIDHTRGLPMVLERYKVKNVVDDGLMRSTGEAEIALLHDWVTRSGAGHRDVRVEDIPQYGLSDDVIDPVRCEDADPELRVLWGQIGTDPGWPETQWGTKPFDNENNHSVAVRVDFGNASFLFTGDLEDLAIDRLIGKYLRTPMLDVDVYKVGHHGSRNGTTDGLVHAMTPRMAVFSMGSPLRRYDWTAWKYGHPNQRMVAMLEDAVKDKRPEVSVRVGTRAMEFENMDISRATYGTGWDGTVIIEASTRGRLTVTTSSSVAAQGDAPPVVDVGSP